MDRETILQQFGELEKRIEHLIETRKRLEADHAELRQRNHELVAQLQEKTAVERRHDELKGLVRSKIDSLMGRLDEITEE